MRKIIDKATDAQVVIAVVGALLIAFMVGFLVATKITERHVNQLRDKVYKQKAEIEKIHADRTN